MKKTFFSLTVILLFLSHSILAQQQFNPQPQKQMHSPTSIGMVIYSNDVETTWNAFRLANQAVNQGDTVQVFLLGKGVEVDNLVNENEDLKEQVDAFLEKAEKFRVAGLACKAGTWRDPRSALFHRWPIYMQSSEKTKLY